MKRFREQNNVKTFTNKKEGVMKINVREKRHF